MEQSQRTGIKKAASSLVLLGLMLAMLLAATTTAFAQGQVSATGTIERLGAEAVVVDGIQICGLSTYAITDEATGQYYDLKSDAMDLEDYVGQRATVTGTSLPSPAIGGAGAERCPDLDVTRVEPAGNSTEEKVTATFELAVECQPPARTGFAASVGEAPVATGALLDQDGDGVYTTSLPVEQGTEHTVRIERLDPISDEPQAPVVANTIKDFGLVEFDKNKTFEASVSFCNDGGGADNTGGDVSGGGAQTQAGGAQAQAGGAQAQAGGTQVQPRAQLPATGGASLLALGAVGALLVGGLLTRKILR